MKPAFVFPCKYDFDLLEKTEIGSFCKHCNNVLKDFSQLSDEQFQNELLLINRNTCGRFRKDQIQFRSNSYLIPGFKAVSLSILTLLGATLLPDQIKAQTKQPIHQASKTGSALSKLKFPLIINGTLKERDGRMPIAYSQVIFYQKGKTRKSTYTDAEGNFSITLKRTDVVDTNFRLILSQAGYKNDTLKSSVNKVKDTMLIKMDIALTIDDYTEPLFDTDTGKISIESKPETPQLVINTLEPKKLTRKERRLLKKSKTKE